MRRIAISGLLVILSGGLCFASDNGKTEAGFESGLAAGLMSAEDRARMAKLPMQDLLDRDSGRHRLMKDDGISSHWGLDAVLSRIDIAPKPYEKLRRADGSYQTERLIFSDTGTGATIMMLTQAPYEKGGVSDELSYFKGPNWNADGSLMVFSRSAKGGLEIEGMGPQHTTDAFGPMVVKADGTGHRIAFGKGLVMKAPICSMTNPDLCYTVIRGEVNEVVELSFSQNKVVRKIGLVDGPWWLKPSPDGKYLIDAHKRGDISVLRIADGKTWKLTLDKDDEGKPYLVHHSYQFVPGDTERVMYWYERFHPGGGLNGEGFHIRNFKTGEDVVVPFRYDWCHGTTGRFFSAHAGGKYVEWDGKTFEIAGNLNWPSAESDDSEGFYPIPVDRGGYAANWPDDQRWMYSCQYQRNDPQWLSEIAKVFAKPLPGGGRANRFRICYTNLWGLRDRWGNNASSLDHPNMSPDGTKLLFNSNAFNKSGVFVVVAAKPLAPANVAVEVFDCTAAEVKWAAPKYHKEIAGYNVYRTTHSGTGFKLITNTPVKGNSYMDYNAEVSQTCYYAVTSVEHSGLESGLSDEVAAGYFINDLPSRVFCEAEKAISAELDAPAPDAIWMKFEGMASGLHYIWQRRADKPGSVKVEINTTRGGKYYVVARMKGRPGAAFSIAGQEVSAPASDEWQWVTSDKPVQFAEGRQFIEIASSKYGSSLDCFYLATDKAFKPAGRIVAERPEALKLSAEAAEGGVRLTWQGRQSKRWHHYNIYCSDKADFAPSRKTLIASPDGQSYLDWQVKPGAKLYYRITQVTIDGLESEASNAASAARKLR